MNNATLPFIATITLSAITGITGTHFHQVSQMVKQGVTSAPVILNTAHLTERTESSAAEMISKSPSLVLPVREEEKVIQPVLPSHVARGRDAREDTLVKILTEQTQMLAAMNAEQKRIRKQLSETNRDMEELTFRVDAQSADFRPLRVDSSRPRSLISTSGSVPDADTNTGGVLPAKR